MGTTGRQETRIQHYVPRFYLKQFTFDKKNKRLRCFDKVSKKTIDVGVHHIAAEGYFYDTAWDKNQEVEKALGQFEGVVNKTYLTILQKRTIANLSTLEKVGIAHFIAVQELRTNESRKRLEAMIRGGANAILTKSVGPSPLVDSLLEDAKPENLKALQVSTIKNVAPKLTPALLQMRWSLLANESPLKFWTSHHPIVRVNEIRDPFRGTLGLGCRGIQVYFPLSPDLCLFLGDPELFGYMPDLWSFKDEQQAVYVNQFQVTRSTRHVFSNRTNFALAEDLIREHPALGELNRKRVEVN